uniref:NADH:ubiquinone reductase (H(+)-translocating) n=1 Tax=Anindobothrium anacolum TaxID=2034264 RepID=A0A8K1SYT5_9CEST|nr:NADH dehydrogenase subunit 5 [Anindobothrium anacolum]
MLFGLFFILIIFCFCVICFENGGYSIFLTNLLLSGSYWDPVFSVDLVSLCILLMLSICFGYAYFYTGHYFIGDVAGIELNKIICLFVAVMATLVLTGDLFTTLIFWEYLGIVSFFLILFYSNYLSLRSSLVTLISSRFGDVCLFLLIAFSLYSSKYTLALVVMYFFIVFSKSAGFPFISWLLEAMRAPTPVSSLVHSSTLVAAGVWFSMRYDMFCYINDSFYYLVLLLLTIMVTGLCCFFFLDLKKIVALSTCNNISWCLIYLILGDVTLSLFQLISHGVSKCLLFMLVGDVMSGTGGSQASNCVYSPRLYGNWGLFGLFSVVLGLSGAPYIGVFFTKHFLLTNFSGSVNIVLLVTLAFCVFLSYFYSFRLCSLFININTSVTCGVIFSFSSGIMVYFWLAINYFIASSLDETSSLVSGLSISLICFQLISIFTGYFFYNSVIISNWSSSLFGCDNIVELSYSIYNSIKNTISIFFYRWDNYFLSLLNGQGSITTLNLFSGSVLNIIMISTVIILVCSVILY